MAQAILFAPYFSARSPPVLDFSVFYPIASPFLLLSGSCCCISRKRPLTLQSSLRDFLDDLTRQRPCTNKGIIGVFPSIEKLLAQSGQAAWSSRYSRDAVALAVRVRTMFVIKTVIKSSNYEKRDARSIDRKDGEGCP